MPVRYSTITGLFRLRTKRAGLWLGHGLEGRFNEVMIARHSKYVDLGFESDLYPL